MALIVERRAIDLPAGPVSIGFRGVADTLVPQTAQVDGLPTPIQESDFDYDLLGPGALIAKSLGQPVHLVRTNPKTGQVSDVVGRLRSGPDGVVVDQADGTAEALHCSGLPERLVFDRAPPGLADTPTLSVRAIAPHKGRYGLTLSYLATGFTWSTDYVARLRPDGKTLDLSGWLTLTNASSTGFPQAPIQVVAGRLARTDDDEPIEPLSTPVAPRCWAHDAWWSLIKERAKRLAEVLVTARRRGLRIAAMKMPMPEAIAPPPPPAPAPPMASQSELGDYKLYTLPEPTTLAANQTKQVRFLDRPGAAYQRIYTYSVARPDPGGVVHLAPQPSAAQITLRLINRLSDGLGQPLPSGHAVVMADADGQQMFIGGDRIEDTPIGADLTLTLGRSPLVAVTPTVVSAVVAPHGQGTYNLAVTATNAGREAATVEIRQDGGPIFKVQAEDRPHTLKGGDPRWTLTVPARGRVVLHYSLVAAD